MKQTKIRDEENSLSMLLLLVDYFPLFITRGKVSASKTII